MASFVGIVTRQDIQTGLTLRAKVTSPQGHYSAYQNFKCMVKPSGLSDLQCVLLDLATITNALITAGVIGIKNNLTKYMPTDGQNGTKVKYTISDSVSMYMDQDGIIKQRPSYGTSDQTGSLTIVVSKGLEAAERQINISIAQYTQEEVVANAAAKLTWDTIRGSNAAESTDISTDGRSNVMYKLNLPTTIDVSGSTAPAIVSWAVTQDILETALTKKRIDVTTGDIVRPAYTEVISMIDSGALTKGTSGDNYTITSLSGQSVIRLGGFKIVADISLGTARQTIIFNLKTLSALLTNQEVATYVIENIALSSNLGEQYVSTANNSSAIYPITQPETIMLFTKMSISLLDAFNLFGASGDSYKINVGTISWQMVNATDQTTPLSLPAYTTGITQLPDSNYYSIEFTSVPTTTTSQDLCLKCTFEASGYDGNKVNVSGYWKFQLKKAA